MKSVSKLTWWLGCAAGLSVCLMAVIVFCEVVSRYIFNNALMIGDEFSAYLLVFCTFLGLAYTMKRGGHIRVTALIVRLRPSTASRLRLVTLVLLFVFVSIYCVECYKLVLYSYQLNLRSETWLRTPQWVIQVVMPLGFTAFILELLVQIKQAIKSLR